MKSRLLTAMLSISLFFGSMPVTAAEPENSISLAGPIVADEGNLSVEDEAEANSKEEQESAETDTDSKEEQEPAETDTDSKEEQEPAEADTDSKEEQEPAEADTNNQEEQETTEEDTDSKEEQEPTGTDTDSEEEPESTETDADSEEEQELTEPDTGIEGEQEILDAESALEAQETASPYAMENITVLECGKINAITIVRDTEDESARWFSFTAPETGYYNFRSNEISSSIEMYLCDTFEGVPKCEGSRYNFITYYIEKGDTVFLNIYLYKYCSDDSMDIEIDIQKLTSASVKSENNPAGNGKISYCDMGDYTLVVAYEIGFYHVRMNISIEAKEGKVLADKYTFYTYLENKADNGTSYIDKIYLEKADNYQLETYLSTDPNMEYELGILAVNAEDHFTTMCVIDSEIIIGKTDEKIIIHDIKTTSNSITLDIEADRTIYCYYAPTDFSAEEDYTMIFLSDWPKQIFTDLKPDTEYYFQFTTSSQKPISEIKVSTQPSEIKAAYSAQISKDQQELELKADVKGYKGDAKTASLHYKYINALGMEVSGEEGLDLWEVTSDDSPVKNFTIKAFLPLLYRAMEAGKQYDITMWVELSNKDTSDNNNEVIPAEVKTIKTPAAAFDAKKLEFSVVTSDSSERSAECTVKINGLDTIVSGQMYYRQIGSKADYITVTAEGDKIIKLSQSAPSKTIEVPYLNNGITYEFVIMIGGVKKSVIAEIGSSGVKLTQIGEGENNPFDLVRTYKLESTDGQKLSGSYYLSLEYLSSYWGSPEYLTLIEDAAELNAENGYQAEIKTAVLETRQRIRPDMDYDIKWVLRDSSDREVYSYCESIHTKKANITFTELESNFSFQKYQVTLDSKDIENFESFPDLRLYAFAKKEGNNSYRYYHKYVDLDKDNGYSNDIGISVLEANTTYELSLREEDGYYIGEKEYEYATTTFTTPEDTRKLNITSIISDFHSIILKYNMTGFTPSQSGAVFCYVREKGTGGKWEKCSDSLFYVKEGSVITKAVKISSYGGEELKEGTEYEYIIGLGGSLDTSFDYLEVMLEGTLQTKADERALSGVGVSAAYTIADITAVLSGNEPYDKSYLYLFYREKNALDWTKANRQTAGNELYHYNFRITGLTQGTEYEYMLVVSDSDNCTDPNEAIKEKQKAGGNFTTRECPYTLKFTIDKSKITTNSAVITVTAEGSDADGQIQVILSLNDGQEQIVVLKKSEKYTADVTFTGLTYETEYTINRAVIEVTENASDIIIADILPDYPFTTRAPEIPEKITLSKEKLYLNAVYDSVSDGLYDGYNSEILEPVIVPETADKDFVYSSSDETVAAVSENGQVIAKGIGTAEITVASKYNKDIQTVCKITVKKYAVGCQTGSENAKIYTGFNDKYSVYKNSCLEDFGLYECDNDGNMTLLSDYTVTSEKPSIADWKEGKLYAYTPGVTALVFEKDDVKARILIHVTTEGRGFGIAGFTTESQYPAIKEEDGSYTLAYTNGISYTAVIEISPKETYDPLDFEWILSEKDQKIAQVSETGVITPKRSGEIQLTVKPITYDNAGNTPFINDEVTVTLHIKSLPNSNSEFIYALANVNATIGEAAFPKKWGEGWSWKYPATPLVTNGVYMDNSYPFEAVYSGTEKYPCERTLLVYIGRITGVSVTETAKDNVPEHKQVLEVGGEDSITLNIEPLYQGKISSLNDYIAEIPDVKGLTITRTGDRTFIVKAQKKGSYTLKPVLRWKQDSSKKVLVSAKYKLKAVDKKQVGAITLTTDTEGIEIKENTIILSEAILREAEDKKAFTFHINAEVKDRYGKDIETTLVWKTTDKKVAVAAPASKKDTHSGNITVKGSGHTVISVTAKDMAGFSTTLNLEVQDHRPRIDTAKASVNLAYDYEDSDGKSYAAAAGGAVELVPVYGETLSTVKLCEQDGQTPAAGLTIVHYDENNKYLIQPSSEDLNVGVYDCSISVTTNVGNEYSYPVKVAVTDKAPGVSVKMGVLPNLFFKNTEGYVNVSITDKGSVSDVTWEDASSDVNNGFSISFYTHNAKKRLSVLSVSQQSNLKLTNGELSDPDVAKGTLTIRLKGYKKLYTFDNFAIKYSYKKPVLVTKKTNSNIVPSVGQNGASFSIYDKTNKRALFYGGVGERCDYYDEILCDDQDITLTQKEDDSCITYRYNGGPGTAKITLTLDSPLWREPLCVVHTVKTITPKAVLSSNTVIFNTNFKSTAYNDVSLKNAENISFTDIVITGANKKSQKLLEDDLFIITTEENRIKIEQGRADLMNASIAAGTYSYKVTPYCTNVLTKEKMALNTMTFKIKVVNKAVKAKVTPKGSLNLIYGASNAPEDKKNTVVLVDPKFSNMGSGYYVSSCRLTGEYSNYFTLHNIETICYAKKYSPHYYISINHSDHGIAKLKAGQKYRLAIEYTIVNEDGEAFTVTSNTFTIKPKQTAPKITVLNNNQTLYAAAADIERSYSLSLPAYYSMKSASGSIDCNKDGKADIEVSGSQGETCLTVKIVDKDAMNATVKGKSYSIPVTVKLYGCDGIAKDVKVKIKVKVIK